MINYHKTIKDGVDTLTVHMHRESDWVYITMQIHDFEPVKITLRSEQAFEDLYYMLTQVRKKVKQKSDKAMK